MKNNYFSFSLYSSSRANFNAYAKGAYENYLTIKNNYPTFRCIFYIDKNTTENEWVKKLILTDSKIIYKDNNYKNQKAVLWRFQPLIEGHFDICFFRDCDSRITKREDILIKKFIESEKNYHVIRDYPHKNKILAGMWGVKKTNTQMSNCIKE